ncbi:hypothetical protein [Marinomonas ostreistagni]|uniref:hypothetical protein n=1 Tax=Marinomonas ostreistagni TaxID=359209 RepID=UPI00194F1133|nr:hypothetical protein [Marinomonas ostreistagni]MBM6549662.1 hypothetical protein [Marinomonas ostreistagni]
MSKKALFLLTSSMFLVACSGLSVQDSSRSTPTADIGADRQATMSDSGNNSAQTSALTSQQRFDRITANLLRSGQQALARNHLLTPEGDNANLYFQVVLGRDPGNYQATLGIAEIVDRYLAWAVGAAERGDSATAKHFLQQARTVNSGDPAILEAEQRVRNLAQTSAAERKQTVQNPSASSQSDAFFGLPKDLFERSDEQVLAVLQPIIDQVAATQAAIEIHWSNDREGRLLYQIINSRTPEFRVRAMIHRSQQHSVEVKDN